MSNTTEATGKPSLSPEALEFFRKAGAKGAAARMRLTPEQRSELARKAYATRRRRNEGQEQTA